MCLWLAMQEQHLFVVRNAGATFGFDKHSRNIWFCLESTDNYKIILPKQCVNKK